MAKISNVRMRTLEILLGAGIGGGGGYAYTGKREGALAGAGAGAALALIGRNIGRAEAFSRRMDSFKSSKKFRSSAEKLVDSSKFMNRPNVVQKKIKAHDAKMKDFKRAAPHTKRRIQAMVMQANGIDPDAFKTLPGLKKGVQSLNKELKQHRKTQNDLMRRVNKAAKREGVNGQLPKNHPLVMRTQNIISKVEDVERDLEVKRSVLEAGLALQREVKSKVNDAFQAHQAALRAQGSALKQQKITADKAIKKQQKAHKKMLEKAQSNAWSDVEPKFFGRF
jgi:hypothetical protein